ncbi:MAG: condensation domain-containing protein, partial [Gammaproteobacteria bacterium]|nr:condensation domain-containing protein [Gammaproteobacteria bacterium]
FPLQEIEPDQENEYEPFPLTDVQQAYLFGRDAAFELGGTSTHEYFEFKLRNLDVKKLEIAWNKLIKRHGMLRCIFEEGPLQKVLAEVPYYKIDIVDYSFEEVRSQLATQIFDINCWPLFDVRVTNVGDFYILHISIDGLIKDAWSTQILFEEWQALYRNENAQLEPINLSFRDYLLAEHKLRSSDQYKKDMLYWKNKLPELSGAPQLAFQKTPAEITQPKFLRCHTLVSSEAWGQLQKKLSDKKITPTSFLLYIYAQKKPVLQSILHYLIEFLCISRSMQSLVILLH